MHSYGYHNNLVMRLAVSSSRSTLNIYMYSTAKEMRKSVTLKLIKNKNMLDLKNITCKTNCKTVCYTVSFTSNMYFLNSTYFIFNQFKSNKFSRFFCCFHMLLGI